MAGALYLWMGAKIMGILLYDGTVYCTHRTHTQCACKIVCTIHTPEFVAHHFEMCRLIHQFTISKWCCAGPAFCVMVLYLYRSWVTSVPRLIHRLLKWCKTHILNLTAQHDSTIADSFPPLHTDFVGNNNTLIHISGV